MTLAARARDLKKIATAAGVGTAGPGEKEKTTSAGDIQPPINTARLQPAGNKRSSATQSTPTSRNNSNQTNSTNRSNSNNSNSRPSVSADRPASQLSSGDLAVRSRQQMEPAADGNGLAADHRIGALLCPLVFKSLAVCRFLVVN